MGDRLLLEQLKTVWTAIHPYGCCLSPVDGAFVSSALQRVNLNVKVSE